MTTLHTLPSPPVAAAADLLHRTVRHIERTVLSPRPPAGVQLVAVQPAAAHLEIGFLDLRGDTIDALAGTVAPMDWWAIGIVGPGRARRCGSPASAHPTADASVASGPVMVVHVVARTGDAVSAVHAPGSDGPRTTVRPANGWGGLVDDHLRRCLGLPTSPPPRSTLDLWATIWLDDLAARCVQGGMARARWPDVAARHPAVVLCRRAGGRADLTRWALRNVDRAAQLLARSWTWPALHEAARNGHDPLRATTADRAGWMDTGLFARTHLARFPAPGELLTVLRDGLRADVFLALEATCRAWGIRAPAKSENDHGKRL